MGSRTSLGAFIALGKRARMIFPFFELFTVDGRRERGARTEVALRTRVDREFDEGDEGDAGREEGRDRGEVIAVAAVVVVVALSALTER